MELRSMDASAKGYLYKYVIEQSYTELDAMFFRQYLHKHLNGDEQKILKTLKKMSSDHLQRLVHNIFPQDDELFPSRTEGNTLMHFLAGCNLGFESVDFIGRLSKKDGFVVPFLPNSQRETPLDLTVARRDHK